MKIILASQSPRRQELLKLIVKEFEIIVSHADEKIIEGLTMEEQSVNISYQKAKDVFDRTVGDRVVIGSDTIVVKNKKIYGKPRNKVNAKKIIEELLAGDRTHEVITGLSVLVEQNGKFEEFNTYDKVKVFFKEMSDEEIQNWIDTGKAMDKAGAYAMQEEFCPFVEKIHGNYTTVVGLPVHKVYEILKKYKKY